MLGIEQARWASFVATFLSVGANVIVVFAALLLGVNGEHGTITAFTSQKTIEQAVDGFLLRRVPFAPVGINDGLRFLESFHRNNRFVLAVV